MGSPKPRPRTDHTLSISMTICLGIAVAVFFAFGHGSVPPKPVDEAWFAFAPLSIDDARLKHERTAQIKGIKFEAAQPDIDHLHAVIRKGNLLQFSPIDGGQTRNVNAEAEYAANDLITVIGGIDGFIETSSKLTHACQNSMQDLLEDIQSGKLDIQLARKQPPLADYQRYAEACGNALALLLERKVVKNDGHWRHEDTGPIILELLGRLRYAYILNLRKPAWEQLTPYERHILWKWRIEDPDAYGYKQRYDFTKQVDPNVLGYDPMIASGRLLFNQGAKKEARRTFEELCKKYPQDRQLGEACSWLKKHVPYVDPSPDGAPPDF